MATTYMPLISSFAHRTSFWPPEAFTLDCRIEERIWEWCEHVLKKNEEFMGLVKSPVPLDMDALWATIQATAYSSLTECIFHYWLIENFTLYKAGGSICQENANWICRKLNLKGPMPWATKAAEPAPAPAPLVAAGAGQPAEKDCSVCVTSGNTMTIIKLSDVPKMSHAELRVWYHKLQIYCAESWSPEDCENAEAILVNIYNELNM